MHPIKTITFYSKRLLTADADILLPNNLTLDTEIMLVCLDYVTRKYFSLIEGKESKIRTDYKRKRTAKKYLVS